MNSEEKRTCWLRVAKNVSYVVAPIVLAVLIFMIVCMSYPMEREAINNKQSFFETETFAEDYSYEVFAGLSTVTYLQKNKDDLLVYGGHELAGGFSLELAKMNDFETHVKAYIDDIRTPDLFVEKSHAILLEDRDIRLENVRGLEALQPFGQGNEEPTFAMRLSHPCLLYTSPYKKADLIMFDDKIDIKWAMLDGKEKSLA